MSETVRYGIDLGTTNSAIARMTAKGPEIIPIRRANYIPSAVAIDRRGDLKVGSEALNPQFGYARWFKRLMGTRYATKLHNGSDWFPESLSAEVLKALAAAARLKTGDEIEDVVITVPAMFNQPQCAATNDAAKIAGLNAVTLLQEPIAAATAYLSENPVEGTYLVYDLGGGTFDVSLVRLRNGEMNVLEHGGDNYLGGADFDRAVFDWALGQIDQKGGNVAPFASGATRLQLFGAIEEARLALSEEAVATIYLDEFDVPVAKLELTRERLEDLVSDLVSRSIEIAKARLRTVGDARAALLVGGPTQMPYVRRRLAAELGIPLSLDQDPMTVVAQGAAVHAGSLLRSPKASPVNPGFEGARLELFYEPVSPDPTCAVAGKVVQPLGLAGEVRIAATTGDWETGWIALRKGAFSTEVSLGRKQLAEFTVELRDDRGRLIPCEPSSFAIQSGVRAAQAVVPYDLSVVLEDGKRLRLIVKAGDPLPASESATFRLTRTILAGSPEEGVVYIVEGDNPVANDNVQIGQVAIRGTDIRRTLKEGERVEVKIRMDESRRVKAEVYVPLIDETYVVQSSSIIEVPNFNDLEASFKEAKTTIGSVQGHISSEDEDAYLQVAREIDRLDIEMDRAKNGEPAEAVKVQKLLADTKASFRNLREKYGLAALYDRVSRRIDLTESLAERFNERMTRAKLGDLREDAAKARRLNEERTLQNVLERVDDLFWPLYMRTQECWEEQIGYLKEDARFAFDSLAYHEHLHAAEKALAANDYEGCRLQVLRAWRLIPDDEVVANRFQKAIFA